MLKYYLSQIIFNSLIIILTLLLFSLIINFFIYIFLNSSFLKSYLFSLTFYQNKKKIINNKFFSKIKNLKYIIVKIHF